MGQIKALDSLATIVSNPSPVAKSALLHPVFSASDIFGDQHVAASRASSTSASSKDDSHAKLTKSLLAAIVKQGKTAVTTLPQQSAQTSVKEEGPGPKPAKLEGKNAVRNRQRKINARK